MAFFIAASILSDEFLFDSLKDERDAYRPTASHHAAEQSAEGPQRKRPRTSDTRSSSPELLSPPEHSKGKEKEQELSRSQGQKNIRSLLLGFEDNMTCPMRAFYTLLSSSSYSCFVYL